MDTIVDTVKIDLTKFKDIQESQVIQIDFTLYFIVITLCILIFSIVLYFLTRKKTIKLTKKDIMLKKLKDIDFQSMNTKKIVYDFTIYGKESLQDEDQNKFDKIQEKLKPYKYIQENKKLDIELINLMKQYIKSIEQCKL